LGGSGDPLLKKSSAEARKKKKGKEKTGGSYASSASRQTKGGEKTTILRYTQGRFGDHRVGVAAGACQPEESGEKGKEKKSAGGIQTGRQWQKQTQKTKKDDQLRKGGE